MKFSLYSNKLDIMYNQLNSDKINADKFISIKNNMNTINSIYDKENNLIDLQSDINSKGLLIDFDEEKGNNKKLTLLVKGNKKNEKDLDFYEKPKKIFVKNKKMNLDELTKKIAERYNIVIKDDNHKSKPTYKNSDAEKKVACNAKSEEKTKGTFYANANRNKNDNSLSKSKIIMNFYKKRDKPKHSLSPNNNSNGNLGKDKNEEKTQNLNSKTENNMNLGSLDNSKTQISTSILIQDASPIKEENKAQKFFSFKSNQEIKTRATNNFNNINISNNQSTNKNYLNVSFNKINAKTADQSSYENSRKLISYSAKKNAVRHTFFATARNLNDSSEQPLHSKSKLPTREKRNSVLFDIMRSAIIDKNTKRKFLGTANNNDGKREKNKFNIYDSSDDSDADIFDKNLTPKFNRGNKQSIKLMDLFKAPKRLSLPSREIESTEVFSNLQKLDSSNPNDINLKHELIKTIGNIKINSPETYSRNKEEGEEKEKNFIDAKFTQSSKSITNNELQLKQSKKSFRSSTSKNQLNNNNNDKIIKRLKIKKTLLGKKLLLKENPIAIANTVNCISPSNNIDESNNFYNNQTNSNFNISGNNYFPINNISHQLSFKTANFLNTNNTNNTNNNYNSHDLSDNPYGFSPKNSKYMSTSGNNNNNINNTNLSNNNHNNIEINSYNFIKKANSKNLSIFDNNESLGFPNTKNSYFSNINSNNKSNSNFQNTNYELANNILLNTHNLTNTQTNNNNTNNSNVNATCTLGASQFSHPYCINIINENEISQIESSKNNSISEKEEESNQSDKNFQTNINSEKSDSIIKKKLLNNNNYVDKTNNNDNYFNLNDKLIIKNLSSRNIDISNFESIDNTNKTNTHSRNAVKKFQNCLSSKDSDNNTRSMAFVNDESTNFCNLNSKGSHFNTLDSGKNLQLFNKNSISKTNSRINTVNNNNTNGTISNNNNNNAAAANPKHKKSLSKGVLFNNNNKNVSLFKKEKSDKSFGYGIIFKDLNNKLDKELISSSDGKRIHKSVKSCSIGKNKKEINMDLELNKIKEEIQEKKIPTFKNQFKLNKYLIRDFKIGEVSNAKQSSKNHLQMTEDYMNYKENKRNKFKLERHSSQNTSNSVFSADMKSFSPKEKNFEEFEKFRNNVFEYKIKTQLYELEREKRDLDQRLKDRIQSKSKNIADKILELNNYSYEEINYDEETSALKQISRKNLEKVMRLRRILKNKANEEIDFFLVFSESKLKEIKNENEDNFTLTLHKLGPPSFLKTKFKNETMNTYKTVNGKFFGC